MQEYAVITHDGKFHYFQEEEEAWEFAEANQIDSIQIMENMEIVGGINIRGLGRWWNRNRR